MNSKALVLFLLFGTATFPLSAQDTLDLLSGLGPQQQPVIATFKSPRVIMTHSIEMLKPGVLDFRILHRFGNVNGGIDNFFGLDQATIRLGLDYGISKNFTIGLGRGNYKKEVDGFVKYQPLKQTAGRPAIPFSSALVFGTTIQTQRNQGTAKEGSLINRMAYYTQLLAGRKFSRAFSMQLAPTLVHRNLVAATDPNNTFALGVGSRIKLSHRTSLNLDYHVVFNKDQRISTYNPLSIGFDIETGGHVFQLHLTNAIGMNERAFITETTNRWSRGDIQFGFNISRAFQLKKKKLD